MKEFLEILEATIEDLAFPNRHSKEPDKVGRRGCIEHAIKKDGGILLFKQRALSQIVKSSHAQFRSR